MKKEVLKKFKGVKFIDIKSVFFKTILQKRTGTTCKARLQFSPLTYRSSSLIVQWVGCTLELLLLCMGTMTTKYIFSRWRRTGATEEILFYL